MSDDVERTSNELPTAWLSDQASRWVAEGVIDPGQASAILALYGQDAAAVDDNSGPGRLIAVISGIGAVLLGIGVILFFAANWSEMGQWVKVAVIFAAIGSAYGLGYVLRYAPGSYPKVGDSMILLGALLFGAGVFLVEQIFHMNANDPTGVLLWTAGVLPLAYLLAHRGVLGLGLLTFLLWFAWGMIDKGGDGDLLFFVLTFVALGVAYTAAGYHHTRLEVYERFQGPYRGLGLIVSFVALHVLTYGWFWEDLRGAPYGGQSIADATPMLLEILFVIGLLAAVTVAVLPRVKRRTLPFEALGMAIVLAAGIATSMTASDGSNYAVLYNLLYFCAALGLVAVGYLNAERYALNIGLFFFAIGVIARYFDFFWDLMPRSMFFILGGVVLLVGSLALERFRRQLITTMPSM